MTQQEIEQKAREFGAKVREAEDSGIDDKRRSARLGWVSFHKNLKDTPYFELAHKIYWDEYCK